MKKYLMFIAILLTGCTAADTQNRTEPEKSTRRVRLIEMTKITGMTRYYIIEVDSHEYLSLYQGGIIHLESCPIEDK